MSGRPYKVGFVPESPMRTYEVDLEEGEIIPKSPIRKKRFNFEELIVRNTLLIMDQNTKLIEENFLLKTKLESLEQKFVSKLESLETENKEIKEQNKIYHDELMDNIKYLAEKFKDKTLPLAERTLKAEELQKEYTNKGEKCIMQRSSNEGITTIKDYKGILRVIY